MKMIPDLIEDNILGVKEPLDKAIPGLNSHYLSSTTKDIPREKGVHISPILCLSRPYTSWSMRKTTTHDNWLKKRAQEPQYTSDIKSETIATPMCCYTVKKMNLKNKINQQTRTADAAKGHLFVAHSLPIPPCSSWKRNRKTRFLDNNHNTLVKQQKRYRINSDNPHGRLLNAP